MKNGHNRPRVEVKVSDDDRSAIESKRSETGSPLGLPAYILSCCMSWLGLTPTTSTAVVMPFGAAVPDADPEPAPTSTATEPTWKRRSDANAKAYAKRLGKGRTAKGAKAESKTRKGQKARHATWKAALTVDCPKCGASAGKTCSNYKGTPMGEPHGDRKAKAANGK